MKQKETSQKQQSSCANCEFRKKAEANPNSLIARLWKWHTKWCPGWKKYQEYLGESGRKA